MSVDPLANEAPEMNPYHFTHNNPLNRTDIDGKIDPLSRFKSALYHYMPINNEVKTKAAIKGAAVELCDMTEKGANFIEDKALDAAIVTAASGMEEMSPILLTTAAVADGVALAASATKAIITMDEQDAKNAAVNLVNTIAGQVVEKSAKVIQKINNENIKNLTQGIGEKIINSVSILFQSNESDEKQKEKDENE